MVGDQTGGFYSQQLIADLKDTFSEQFAIMWRMTWQYRSNWRVLHIDNFEGSGPLPSRAGRTVQFFRLTPIEPMIEGANGIA
jgi:hypothetical protein